ncbi:type VI lipase adapter Tla3 domain-containing protein [Massilia sp. TSP1-1-2]|uniref:type VI lipase adapter Tla3 domain-containing protein n=1 Tax=Massilia sp. TSP1-1-2 TaxID=2804649 RepID=UPI003CE98645
MNGRATGESPKLWKFLLAALIALIILIPLWTIFVMSVVRPESLLIQEQTMGNRMLWWVAGPVAVVALFFGVRWIGATNKVQAKEVHVQAAQTQQIVATDQSKREYVLEVIGLGATLDKYRQGKLWEALQKGSPFTTIREQDKEKYPWSAQEKSGLAGGRAGDSLENGAQYTPMYYGVPVFNAAALAADPDMADRPDEPNAGLAGSAVSSGMAWHLFVVGPRRFSERPDHILEDIFTFFDGNPDVPYIVLNSDDSMESRDSNRLPGTPKLLKDGKYVPEMPDTSALFVLARRERVDPVRKFAWDDPDNSFVQNVFRSMYAHLMAAVPHPRREKVIRTPAQVGADPVRHEDLDAIQRQPLINEWLEAAAAFAKRSDVRGSGAVSLVNITSPTAHHPPKDWRPTPWFPIPWNKEQLATFDKLPTLGFIHRPTFVKFTDEHGKPITRRDERDKVLQAGWQAALLTLPEGERAKAPVLVIAATGDDSSQVTMLHSALNAYAAHGGPEIDTAKSSQFIDTDKRLGNTGATTLFMQMAIGVMGSYREGGVSAAINLRDKNEASIVFISPPSEDKRKTQKHPKGGDVFAHHGTPAVDPANYQQ